MMKGGALLRYYHLGHNQLSFNRALLGPIRHNLAYIDGGISTWQYAICLLTSLYDAMWDLERQS